MQNPFRSEADAFRFVWLTIGYFALIVDRVGDQRLARCRRLRRGSRAVALWWLLIRNAGTEAPVRQAPAPSPAEQYRILVVANETVGGGSLLGELRQRSEGKDVRVLVVCPALNSPLRRWASDEDDARTAAQARLDASLAGMRAAGVQAEGEVGDGDPIQAIEDALRTFRPDELIISTHPEGRSHWLERGVVEKARERFALPLTHVVVDLEAERR